MTRIILFLSLLLVCATLRAEDYATRIVDAMTGQKHPEAVALTREALGIGRSADMLMRQVKQISIGREQNSLYLDYLLLLKNEKPAVVKDVDVYLLHYYAYRDDPQMMMSTAQKLLRQYPDNVEYLTILAQGQLKANEIDECLATNKHILELDKTNVTALLYLANYYYDKWEKTGDAIMAQRALDYTRRASALIDTPRLHAMTAALTRQR